MKENILLIRLSSLGDILMTVPIVDVLARQYPELDITMVSRPYAESIFSLLPDNVHFVGIDPHSYPEYTGPFHMYRILASLNPDKFCNLHNVLRTNIIESLFKLSGVPTSRFIKDRIARRNFVVNRPVEQQISSFQRSADALSKLGYPINIHPEKPYKLIVSEEKIRSVGIAPFASYNAKEYPIVKMEKVVSRLCSETEVYLFGAGRRETAVLTEWEKKYPNVHCVAGTLGSMAEELRLIARLSVMLTMDSSNMHLASLVGVPVVSIWGTTHPFGGFLGWGQSVDNAIQLPMDCRPCSIYGQTRCKRGDCACIRDIDEDIICKKVLGFLEMKPTP